VCVCVCVPGTVRPRCSPRLLSGCSVPSGAYVILENTDVWRGVQTVASELARRVCGAAGTLLLGQVGPGCTLLGC